MAASLDCHYPWVVGAQIRIRHCNVTTWSAQNCYMEQTIIIAFGTITC